LYRLIRKGSKSSLNGGNLISAINMCAIPLVCYTAGLIKWTQTETLDISTRKLLTLYKCFGMKDDVDRLYVPRKRGGRGLLSGEDFLHHEKLSLVQYLANSDEPLLKAIYQMPQWRGLEELPAMFKIEEAMIILKYGETSHCMANLLENLMRVSTSSSTGLRYITVI